MDDLVLLATDPIKLQLALDLVFLWSRRVRMNINVGDTKSAVMASGAAKLLQAIAEASFRIGQEVLPWISLGPRTVF